MSPLCPHTASPPGLPPPLRERCKSSRMPRPARPPPRPPLLPLPQLHGPPSCSSTRPGSALPQGLGTGRASHLECFSAFAHRPPPPRGLPGPPLLFKNIHPSFYPHTLPIIFPFNFSHHFTNATKSNLFSSSSPVSHCAPSGHRGQDFYMICSLPCPQGKLPGTQQVLWIC